MRARRANAGHLKSRQGRRRRPPSNRAGAVVVGAIVGLFLLSIAWRLRPAAQATTHIEAPPPDLPLRVLVVNGCGKKGLAAVFGVKLRRYAKATIDVVDFADAPVMDYGHSVVIGHGDGARWAPFIGSVIGCDSTDVGPPARADIDLTVILGSDFPFLFPTSNRWWETP